MAENNADTGPGQRSGAGRVNAQSHAFGGFALWTVNHQVVRRLGGNEEGRGKPASSIVRNSGDTSLFVRHEPYSVLQIHIHRPVSAHAGAIGGWGHDSRRSTRQHGRALTFVVDAIVLFVGHLQQPFLPPARSWFTRGRPRNTTVTDAGTASAWKPPSFGSGAATTNHPSGPEFPRRLPRPH